MMFNPPSRLPGSETVIRTTETPGAESSDLTTSPSQTPPGTPTFYLAPSIVQAIQHTLSFEPNSSNDFWHFVERDNPVDHTLLSNYINDESIETEQTVEPSSNNTSTSAAPNQASQQDPVNAARPSFRAQQQGSYMNEQGTMDQQKEEEAETRVVELDLSQIGFSESNFMIMKNMLAFKKLQLNEKHYLLVDIQRSNLELRTRLFDATEELAGVQKRLSQKDSYILACDKKIYALQKRITLLTRPYNRSTAEEVRTGKEKISKAESELHMSTLEPKKISVLPSQPSTGIRSVTRSSNSSQITTSMDTKTMAATEKEARLKDAHLEYEALLEEKEALFSRVCKKDFEKQAELEDRYMLGAMSEKLRRVVRQCLWENHELTVENEKLREENEELREQLDQAHTTNSSKPDHDVARPKTSEGTLHTVSQPGNPEIATSPTEADREGHGDIRANSPQSQGSPCGSDWASVERPNVEREWPHAWW